MKHLFIICAFILLTAVVSGCEESTQTDTDEVKVPKVEIIANEHPELNTQEKVSANVYYGEDLVDDAEVTFEIKKGEEEDSDEVIAELTDTGTYTIQYTFTESDTYSVTAHTNVKGYHTMPTITIQAGERTETPKEDIESK